MNSALFPDAPPIAHDDGTLTATVARPVQRLGDATVMTLALPARHPAEHLAGRYLLARCGAQSADERAEQWSIYLRRPLFPIARPRPVNDSSGTALWQFHIPGIQDPGYAWLAALWPGATVNLLGPWGNGFSVQPTARRLLLVAEFARALRLLPLIDDVLDRNGQVSLVIVGEQSADPLRTLLPLTVEVHQMRSSDEWAATLASGIRWCDQICAAIPPTRFAALADQISELRFRLDPGFAFVLMESDLACGFGACLACVVPLANGNLTRACMHGPVFDLLELTGKR